MAQSRRRFIRAGAFALPGLACAVLAPGAQAAVPAAETGMPDVLKTREPVCTCPLCLAGTPPPGHVL